MEQDVTLSSPTLGLNGRYLPPYPPPPAAPNAVASLQPSTREWLHIDDDGVVLVEEWAPDAPCPVKPRKKSALEKVGQSVLLFTTLPESSLGAWIYSKLMMLAIVLSTVTFVIATMKRWDDQPNAQRAFAVIEAIVVQIFLADYLVRFVVCDYGYEGILKDKLRFVIVSAARLPFFYRLHIYTAMVGCRRSCCMPLFGFPLQRDEQVFL